MSEPRKDAPVAANNHDSRGVVDGGARDRLLAISRRELADRQVSPGEPQYVDVTTGEPRTRGGFDAEWNPAYERWSAHYRPIDSIQKVLAEFFDIDQDALEREKREMLDAIWEANRAR